MASSQKAGVEGSSARGSDEPANTLKLVLVVAVALIDEQHRVLLAQRPKGKPMAGLWEFPGGKVDIGETPEAALVRELHEELNIQVDAMDLVPLTFASHSYNSFHLLMPLLTMSHCCCCSLIPTATTAAAAFYISSVPEMAGRGVRGRGSAAELGFTAADT
eukprot:gene13822-biopygen15746